MESTQSTADSVRATLDDWGVPYGWLEIDPEFADTAQFCERYGYTLEDSVNCILVVGKSEPRRYAACLVQATRRLDVNRAVKRLLGVRRVSFASAEETVALTGMQVGGVTPVALPPGMPVYVDAPVLGRGEIVLGGGDRAGKLLVSPGALLAHLPGAEVVEDLSTAPPA
ncbi:YbaK/EbsC family protein [Kitasatospora sp. NPDC085879]|jgi:prolyl-tRNA editing enzyme YbaK/EbsC (Cys-tRNA(Pro) deacylase)|uniref:YbaK/EbsC family protein n=1 Tax=Kitasatospora sp. NPDC085879 TaxID=3154769 RepID=UPI000BB1627C|nr:YbaK/EbsC family protein [Streptomyces sp. TLI_235]PBC70996.1 prolyl-tRNA editing enzyme YbaK/EbsC (Cys-tRNA(Pro) deacylase) [Streptomyces sp. TLI_235]